MLALIAAPLLLLSPNASAQHEVCNVELGQADWRDAMDAVDAAIRNLNGAMAKRLLDDLGDVFRCAVEPISPADLGRFARQRSALGFYAQDSIETERWALLARETVGWAPWPESLLVPRTYHSTVDALEDAERAGPADVSLVPPKRGAVLADGRLLVRPELSVDVPHLMQMLDKKQRVVWTRWQDGAAFADDLLGPRGPAPEAPDWYEKPPPPVSRDRAAPRVVAASDEPEPELTLTFDMGQITNACPWRGEARTVELDKEQIEVNRIFFPMKTDAERAEFREALRNCGELDAVRYFDQWQHAKRKVFSGGGKYEERMVKALRTLEMWRREQAQQSLR